MLDTGETSIKIWIKSLHSDYLLSLLIGCGPEDCPSLGSHYDLIDRLWLRRRSLEKEKCRELHKCSFFTKPKKTKLKKGEKLSPKKPGVVKKIVEHFLEGHSVRMHYERLLQEIFVVAAIIPSIHEDLIAKLNLTVAGDGTCLPVHASPYGMKECDCQKKGIWGWDSSKEQWLYGHETGRRTRLNCYDMVSPFIGYC